MNQSDPKGSAGRKLTAKNNEQGHAVHKGTISCGLVVAGAEEREERYWGRKLLEEIMTKSF